jgi:hypothetical protein
MCDSKCFFSPIDYLTQILSNFQKDVNAIQKYLITDLSSILQVVKTHVFNIATFGIGFRAAMQANMIIKQNYLEYILKYGVPADGNFDPTKLAEFS